MLILQSVVQVWVVFVVSICGTAARMQHDR
jgi:hypothetical protein